MTSAETKFTPEVAAILDTALDGGTFTPWTTLVLNRWGGFDITGLSQVIRVTNDDGQWTITILTTTHVELGVQTFAGCFAHPAIVGLVVRGLL